MSHIKQPVGNSVLLVDHMSDLKKVISDKQKEIHRTLTPVIKARMEPVYVSCAKRRGTGAYERIHEEMLKSIKNNIETENMFQQASDKMAEELAKLQVEFGILITW